MTPPFPSILVCVDGSPASQSALQAALALGKGARLRGLFVKDSKSIASHFFEDLAGAAGAAPFTDAEGQARSMLEQVGRVLLAQFEKGAQAAGARYESVMIEDNVADGILHAAKDVDLVVMGKKGAHGSGQAAPVGSNLERVVRHSPVPVLVVPAKAKPRFKRLLAGFDDSAHARETLILAGGVARALKASLSVLHVSTDPQEGRSALKRAEVLLKERKMPAKLELKKGEAAVLLPALARAAKHDLLVLGAYGSGFLREFLLGSTTDLVLRETRTPLLIHR